MSKVTVTMCDCCRKEITGKPFEPDLFLIVVLNNTKMTCHYCYECGAKIINAINQIVKATNHD
jgi:hypothetical protein